MGLFASFNPVAAIGNIAGSLIQSKTAKSIARDQMDFQYDMSNSAHQREARDLEAAGLNRILTATGGSGASTPSGASAAAPENIIGGAINQGFSAKQKSLEQQAIEANILKTSQDTKTSAAAEKTAGTQAALNLEMANKVKADTQLAINSAANVIKHGKLLDEKLPYATNMADIQRGTAPYIDFGSRVMRGTANGLDTIYQGIGRGLTSIYNSARNLVSTPKK